MNRFDDMRGTTVLRRLRSGGRAVALAIGLVSASILPTSLPQTPAWASEQPEFTGLGTIAGRVENIYRQDILNVTVQLVRVTDNQVVATVHSAEYGAYLFEDVPYGTYLLRFPGTTMFVTGYLGSTDVESATRVTLSEESPDYSAPLHVGKWVSSIVPIEGEFDDELRATRPTDSVDAWLPLDPNQVPHEDPLEIYLVQARPTSLDSQTHCPQTEDGELVGDRVLARATGYGLIRNFRTPGPGHYLFYAHHADSAYGTETCSPVVEMNAIGGASVHVRSWFKALYEEQPTHIEVGQSLPVGAQAFMNTALTPDAKGTLSIYDGQRLVTSKTFPPPPPGFAWIEAQTFSQRIEGTWTPTTVGRHTVTTTFTGTDPCCARNASTDLTIDVDPHSTLVTDVERPFRIVRGKSAEFRVLLTGGRFVAGGTIEIRKGRRVIARHTSGAKVSTIRIPSKQTPKLRPGRVKLAIRFSGTSTSTGAVRTITMRVV